MATSGLWRIKSIEQSIADIDDPQTRLRRNLGALDLTVFGVAVSIGAGIFVLAAQQARDTAGPAVSLSFVLAAIACGFAVLCYAELASTVPVAGSAYTYSYATALATPPSGDTATLATAFTNVGLPWIALSCLWLMLNLSVGTWIRFLVWLAIGLVIHFVYGARKSRLREGDRVRV
jgi:amino acid transporter